jgi:hypothetical protein
MITKVAVSDTANWTWASPDSVGTWHCLSRQRSINVDKLRGVAISELSVFVPTADANARSTLR